MWHERGGSRICEGVRMTSALSSGLPRAHRLGGGWRAFALGTVLLCIAYSLLLLPGSAVDWLVKEDGLVEWLGALGLFAGAGLFLAAFVVAHRRGPDATGLSRLGIWFLLLMAVLLFVAGGEEISWGQRIFGFGNPNDLGEFNAQGETNLHNLNAFQGTAIDGDRLFKIGYFGLFVLLPAIALLSSSMRRRLERLVPIVVPWLAALFLMAWVLATIARLTFEGAYSSDAIYPLTHSIAEVLEALVEIMAGVVGYLSWQRMRHGPPLGDAVPVRVRADGAQ